MRQEEVSTETTTKLLVYSRDVIEHFQKKVKDELEKVNNTLNEMKGRHINKNGASDTETGHHKTLQPDSVDTNKEETEAEIARLEKHKINLINTQTRLYNKTFGICYCRYCKGKKLIPLERLESSPVAKTCCAGK